MTDQTTLLLPPLAVSVFIAAGAVTIGHLDYEAELQRQEMRQEMEAIWCRGAELGLSPSERAGWPPETGCIARR